MSEVENEEVDRLSDLNQLEIQARINKLREEAEYIATQRRFYPFVVLSGTAAAILAFVKLVF